MRRGCGVVGMVSGAAVVRAARRRRVSGVRSIVRTSIVRVVRVGCGLWVAVECGLEDGDGAAERTSALSRLYG